MPHQIETPRLLLREFSESDIPELLPLIGAPEVAATTLRIPHPYEEKHAREFFATTPKENELRLAIRLRSTGRLCGGIGLHPDTQHSQAELGYWIGVPFWGNGYATEAAGAVIAYGFKKLKLERIFASHFKGNRRSGRVLQKIGMRHEGSVRHGVMKSGKLLDLETYAIVREDRMPASQK
ncbi:MAG TPA: GNAT family N-acetyltransferase [Terriglobales bacterium]|jgi:RimJ/RimL family protein N-acetyltransferase|nr:GNAT family N-acetyltransferase [Terriglobales bacterium]